MAESLGITTKFDKQRAKIEEKIKELEAKGGEETDELIRLRIQRLELIKKQHEQIKQKAHEAGDSETEKMYSDHEPVVKEQKELQLKLLGKLKEEFLEAQLRDLELRRVPEDQTKIKLKESNTKYYFFCICVVLNPLHFV